MGKKIRDYDFKNKPSEIPKDILEELEKYWAQDYKDKYIKTDKNQVYGAFLFLLISFIRNLTTSADFLCSPSI